MSDPLDQLTPELLVARYPKLWHMAEAKAWASIKSHGLLSTTGLLDLFGVEGDQRTLIEARRRTESVRLEHPDHGVAWVRDNLPINETVLRRTLTGMGLEDFYRLLNGRVFFWVSRERLDRLRNAAPYRDRKHDILVLDTAAVVERHGAEIELCHLNSGAVHPAADYLRGVGTFQKIEDYPWSERCKVSSEPLVEVTIPYGVEDIDDLVLSVTTE